MGSLYSLSLLALLLVTFVDQICGSEVKDETNPWFVEGNKTSGRVFEEQLEQILRSVLKNGLPALNIPPLDPFVYKDNVALGDTGFPGMITLEYFELGDFVIDGLSSFVTNLLSFNLSALTITVNITFPIELKANHSNFSIIVGDLIPFNGEGPAALDTDLRVEAVIVLGDTDEGYMILEALTADIFFNSLEVEFSTVMGLTGGKEAHIYNKLIGCATPDLIDLMKPYMIDDILSSLLTVANGFLLSAKISYVDIINCFLGFSDCPYGLL